MGPGLLQWTGPKDAVLCYFSGQFLGHQATARRDLPAHCAEIKVYDSRRNPKRIRMSTAIGIVYAIAIAIAIVIVIVIAIAL